MFNFEKLAVTQKAVTYVGDVDEVAESFSDRERFDRTNQFRRDSVPISSNFAEEDSRSSSADYSHFLEIAYGSLMETVSQKSVAKRRRFSEETTFDRLDRSAGTDPYAERTSGVDPRE